MYMYICWVALLQILENIHLLLISNDNVCVTYEISEKNEASPTEKATTIPNKQQLQ